MVVVSHQANFQFPGHSEKVGFVDHESRIILPWGGKKYDTVPSDTGLKKHFAPLRYLETTRVTQQYTHCYLEVPTKDERPLPLRYLPCPVHGFVMKECYIPSPEY
jgi:hypothetical protein